ncbi:MAG TPA: hypothetical protein VFH61_06880 [Thermoleophilia bacterium]|nr:hypothetical protein [Thermoleophilia bacterium]
MALQGILGFESVTVAATAIGFDITPASNNGMKPQAALITVETAAIRFTTDGTTPTATVGHVVEAGGSIELADSGQCDNFLAIRRDGVSATIRVSTAASWAG